MTDDNHGGTMCDDNNPWLQLVRMRQELAAWTADRNAWQERAERMRRERDVAVRELREWRALCERCAARPPDGR